MLPKHKLLLAASALALVPLFYAFKVKGPVIDSNEIASFKKNEGADTSKAPRIQVAILLDVSGSMDGLIDQAKAQLWNLVSLLGKAECKGGTPRIEIALYEYGRDSNPVSKGYIRRISAFSTDLDSLSKNLFALTTNGGSEYCPQVIYTSAKELDWDTSAQTYRAIFIAGNETFWQGKLTWTEACDAARAKGIVVNTIYCGDRMSGINEHWNLGAECGRGSYSNINSNAKLEEISTPYDSALYTLNDRLNGTMIGYSIQGNYKLVDVASVDKMNSSFNKSAAAKRMEVKANKKLYRNDSWEMVDAYETDSTVITRMEKSTLPDSLKNASAAQLKVALQRKLAERDSIRNEIAQLSINRNNWLNEERKKRTQQNQESTLETEMEKILKQQVLQRGFTIR
jgi:hypothetical protein